MLDINIDNFMDFRSQLRNSFANFFELVLF